jgi:hypothetical protein
MNTQATNSVDQLAALFPEPMTIHIAGTDVVVGEMTVRKIAKFATLLAPVLARFPAQAPFDLPAVFAAGTEAVIAGVAHAVDQSEDWIGRLPGSEFEKLMRALQEMNPRFFITGVGLLVSVVTEKMLQMAEDLMVAATTGQPSSSASSSADTATPAATH